MKILTLREYVCRDTVEGTLEIKGKLSYRLRNNNTREETIKGEEMEIRMNEKEQVHIGEHDDDDKGKERTEGRTKRRENPRRGK